MVHVALDLKPDAICQQLRDAGLSNICVPSPAAFVEVAAIPTLGSGKLDLKALRDVAREHLN